MCQIDKNFDNKNLLKYINFIKQVQLNEAI